MTFNIFSRYLCLWLLAALLTGCAAPVVRTLDSDKTVKSVAVVSLLNERTTVDRIGLTVFNNKSVVVDQTGALNAIATETLQSSLRKSRPSWQIKDAQAEVPDLMAAKKAGGTSWTSQVSAFSDALATTAAKLDVDLMFVIVDTSLENLPGRGVGAQLRTLSLTSVKDLSVYAVTLVVLVDRNGKEITNRWGGHAAFATIPAADMGIDYDMTSISTPGQQEKLKELMQERLRAAIKTSATAMGY